MGPADKYRSLIVIIDLREHSQTTKLVIPVQTDPHFASRTSYRGQLVRNNQLPEGVEEVGYSIGSEKRKYTINIIPKVEDHGEKIMYRFAL